MDSKLDAIEAWNTRFKELEEEQELELKGGPAAVAIAPQPQPSSDTAATVDDGSEEAEEEEDAFDRENPNQCSARHGHSRCHKLAGDHKEHHNLITGKRWTSR